MITIRLRRIGKKKIPIYNLVLCEHTAPIQGKFIEKLGLFNPTAKDETQRLKVNDERIKYWLSKGAKTSDTVNNLLVGAKVLEEKNRIKTSSTKKKKEKEEKPEKPAEIQTASEPEEKGESILEKVEKSSKTPSADEQTEKAVPITSEEVSGSRPESVGKIPTEETKPDIPAEKKPELNQEAKPDEKPAEKIKPEQVKSEK